MAVSEYRCERSDLFERLAEQAWFESFIKYQYCHVVFCMEALAPILSDYWIAQAHLRYANDIKRISQQEYKGRPLDHFKHAGFLCYWLRRCPPLTDLVKNANLAIASIKLREPQEELLYLYGNVFAAFDIGLRICRFWEASRTDVDYPDAIRTRLRSFGIRRDSEYTSDICYTLAQKNISPHSLNMLYKSIFIGFRP